jgi:hypothetical protein
VNELTDWLPDPVPSRFPYDAVVAEFHRVGKHFVSDRLLGQLATARERLAGDPTDLLLGRFLDVALDKWDGRYDYPSYTALSLLDLPVAGAARDRRDRLVVQLLGDLLRFELTAAEGQDTPLPELRPDHRLVEKRCRLGIRVAGPALARLGHDCPPGSDPAERAAGLWKLIDAELLADRDRRLLTLSMLPVYRCHDEYLFIRVLQTFEATFALLAAGLRAAIAELAGSPNRSGWRSGRR